MNLFLPMQNSFIANINFYNTGDSQIQILNDVMYCLCKIALSLAVTTARVVRKIQDLYFIFSPAWLG